LSEKRGRLDDAEQFYTKGAILGAIGTNPNRLALRRVYEQKHGSLDGYDAYLAGIAESDRAARKAEIAATRATTPAALKAFKLRTLDGKLVSLDSLRGRAAVINNWGMWCGPCVAEMPEFQKLAVQYAADTSVRILTIDNDSDTEALRAWMQKKSYTFATLIDDGYLSRTGNHTYPTTWFLDARGRVVFTKIGWSEKLVEEFGWRIDMLRPSPPVP
jgi:thiol-disulfide isomerase/thioredoxin